jgi:hypothetical protein
MIAFFSGFDVGIDRSASFSTLLVAIVVVVVLCDYGHLHVWRHMSFGCVARVSHAICWKLQMYINCPGGSTYSIMAIYDAMQWVSLWFFFVVWRFVGSITSCEPPQFALHWSGLVSEGRPRFLKPPSGNRSVGTDYTLSAEVAVLLTSGRVMWMQIKPDVSTVCFGIAASQGALLLAGGKKGKRFAMPNARIMIHQPQGGCGVLPLTSLLSLAIANYETVVWRFSVYVL